MIPGETRQVPRCSNQGKEEASFDVRGEREKEEATEVKTYLTPDSPTTSIVLSAGAACPSVAAASARDAMRVNVEVEGEEE
jgi:hypothetical protein